LTEAAGADLATEASEAVATNFISKIEAAFEPVRLFPFASPARATLAPGLRVTFHGVYAIYHQPLPDVAVIVRVPLGARDVTALAERGDFSKY
jgi:plasmid stabilization system protein ParE